MTPELQEQLKACHDLPSPPGVATQIIEIANDPEVDVDRIIRIISLDPALSIKILRLANSPMYAQQARVETLRKAVLVLGLNATISLALSFSLLKSWRGAKKGEGLDYALFWRRALLAGTVGRALAPIAGVRDAEELFLPCLIQDVGMLALARAVKGLYAEIGPDQRRQEALIRRERDRLGVDHAAVGGWLLKRWNFPARIEQGVAASHEPRRIPRSHENGLFARCVALSSVASEVLLDRDGDRDFQRLAALAQEWLALNATQVSKIIEEVNALLPSVESAFETEVFVDASAESILDEAREVLMFRSLRTLRVVEALEDKTHALEVRTRELEQSNQRDALTGLYNRRRLNEYLDTAFRKALEHDEPLSIAFADLDRFKSINDTYGHHAGDQILVATARHLEASTRSSDMVTRYGGEEFLLVFPNTDQNLARLVCERIIESMASTRHEFGQDALTVTISIGIATHEQSTRFGSAEEAIRAADIALYAAKQQGRNRCVSFDQLAESPLTAVAGESK